MSSNPNECSKCLNSSSKIIVTIFLIAKFRVYFINLFFLYMKCEIKHIWVNRLVEGNSKVDFNMYVLIIIENIYSILFLNTIPNL